MNIKFKDSFIKVLHTYNVIDESLDDAGNYIVASHWYVPAESKQFISAENLSYKVKSYKKAKFYMMANSEREYDNYIKYFDKEYVFFCSRHFNHGLKSDGTNIFYPKNIEKKYDFIFNGGHNKQQEKLKYIKNLCILNKYAQEPKVKCDYYNKHKLSLEEVSDFINLSRIGLITTEMEGASWASLEFLLCGIPVISCKSLGGRDIFYNNNNSIIIETPEWYANKEKWCEILRDASYNMLSDISKYDSQLISSDCINKLQEHKGIFVKKVIEISNSTIDKRELINILNKYPEFSFR